MKWRIECQTCKHASCYGYGLVSACDKDECKYEPHSTTATSSTFVPHCAENEKIASPVVSEWVTNKESEKKQ